jgi:hypothetical protein
MTKQEKINKFISENYNWLMKEVKKNIAKGKMEEYSQDLLHHILLDLYKLSDEKIDQMLDDDKMKWYVLSGCGLQLRSSTSPFYRIHRKEKMQSRENYVGGGEHEFNYSGTKGILEQEYVPYQSDPLYDCMEREMENLHFYYRTLLEDKYFKSMTLKDMHIKYGITISSLSKDLKIAYSIIRTKCNCEL